MERGNDRVADDLGVARRELLEDSAGLDAAALRAAFLDLYEGWLEDRAREIGVTELSGFAIVGIGGLGRREILPQSDLDLLLVHDGTHPGGPGEIADKLWYPIWDANVRLDHSVRTVDEAVKVAGADMTAVLGMLQARHIAGDERLSSALIERVRRQWRSGIRSRMDELIELTTARWRRCGRVFQRAEPDLKAGRGGLRDVQLLHSLALAQLIDLHSIATGDMPTDSLNSAHLLMLNARTELHRVSGRGRDQLLAQYGDEISAALGEGDRFGLARRLSDAGRTISYQAEAGLRTAARSLPTPGVGILRRRPKRRPISEGVVESSGEILLALDAKPEVDPGLVLRVAAASAKTGLPISSAALNRLASVAPDLPEPWPKEALDDLLVVLLAGPRTVDVIEALDRTGLWRRLLPEWDAVRDLPPRDVSHVWTVDRHNVETAVHAAPLSTRVARSDLLAIGALLHDIGKGRGVDHCTFGADLVIPIVERMGLSPTDVQTISDMVRHHLLLPITATRSDLKDPQVIESVADTLGGDPHLLNLLHVLTEADSKATGPGVWSDWKASLVAKLVRGCRMVMAGEELPTAIPTAPQYLSLTDGNGIHVGVDPADGERFHVVMVAPSAPGVVSIAAAVLALNSLRIHSATANAHDGVVVIEFMVSPTFGDPTNPGLLRQQFLGALNGTDVRGVLEERDRESSAAGLRRFGEVQLGAPLTRSTAPPRVLWLDTATPGQLILEVRAADKPALLSFLARAFEHAGADIAWAKVNTFGSTASDVFCLTTPSVLSQAAAQDAVQRHLVAVLGADTEVIDGELVGD